MTVHTPIEARPSGGLPPWAIGTHRLRLPGRRRLPCVEPRRPESAARHPGRQRAGGLGRRRARSGGRRGTHRRRPSHRAPPAMVRTWPDRPTSRACTASPMARRARTSRISATAHPRRLDPPLDRRHHAGDRGHRPRRDAGLRRAILAGADRLHRRLPDDAALPLVTDPAAHAERGVPVLIGADEMARIDEAAQKLGLTEDALMESAGRRRRRGGAGRARPAGRGRADRAARWCGRRWRWCCVDRATTAATASWSLAGWRPSASGRARSSWRMPPSSRARRGATTGRRSRRWPRRDR